MRRAGSIVVLISVAIGAVLTASAGATVAGKASKRDKAILAAGALRVGDVPSGWTSKPPAGGATNSLPKVAACAPIQAASDAAAQVPSAKSPQFLDPTAVTLADDQVFAYKTVKAARSYLARYEASDAPSCLQTVYEQPFGPKGAQVQGTPTVSPITDLQGVGDENVGYEVVVNLTIQGQDLVLYWDLVYARIGRAAVHFVFNNASQTLPQGRGIMDAVITRLRGAAG